MRIFLDANILFSAALTDGAVRRLLHDLTAASHACVADGYVWEEARRNLGVISAEAVAELHRITAGIEFHFHFAGAGAHAVEIELEEKDRPVLASAIALDCDALVTGDRTHVGRLYGSMAAGVAIHSPRSLAEALLDEWSGTATQQRSTGRSGGERTPLTRHLGWLDW